MNTTLSIVAGVGVLALGSQARADDTYSGDYKDTGMKADPAFYSYAWSEPRLRSDVGVGVVLGGGLTGFTQQEARDAMTKDVGGLWDLRVSLGTHIPIGIDISYLGTSSSVQLLGLDDATLVGTTVEAAVRYNLLPHNNWNPYLFAGVGWQRYDIRDAPVATAVTGMDSDSFAEFPMGTGISFRDRTGLVADLRGTFRAASESTLLRNPLGDNPNLHTWEASAAIGYEF